MNYCKHTKSEVLWHLGDLDFMLCRWRCGKIFWIINDENPREVNYKYAQWYIEFYFNSHTFPVPLHRQGNLTEEMVRNGSRHSVTLSFEIGSDGKVISEKFVLHQENQEFT